MKENKSGGKVSKELGHHNIITEQSESELSQKLGQSVLGEKNWRRCILSHPGALSDRTRFSGKTALEKS